MIILYQEMIADVPYDSNDRTRTYTGKYKIWTKEDMERPARQLRPGGKASWDMGWSWEEFERRMSRAGAGKMNEDAGIVWYYGDNCKLDCEKDYNLMVQNVSDSKVLHGFHLDSIEKEPM